MTLVFERSSGFAGYRCSVCHNWMYENEQDKHTCPGSYPTKTDEMSNVHSQRVIKRDMNEIRFDKINELLTNNNAILNNTKEMLRLNKNMDKVIQECPTDKEFEDIISILEREGSASVLSVSRLKKLRQALKIYRSES